MVQIDIFEYADDVAKPAVAMLARDDRFFVFEHDGAGAK